MYSVDDIFTRLQKGEDANAIAQEMADALNGALDRKHAEEKAAAERQANVQKREKQMIAAQDICDMLNAFLREYYDVNDVNAVLTAEELVDCCDQASEAINSLTDHLNKMKAIFGVESNSKDKRDNTSADDAIRGFLRAFGL